MKYKLEIQLDMGKIQCGKCRMIPGIGAASSYCSAFQKYRKYDYHNHIWLRLPECLKKAKLVKEIKP